MSGEEWTTDAIDRPDSATVKLRRLEKKLARARASRDKLRAEMRVMGSALRATATGYYAGEVARWRQAHEQAKAENSKLEYEIRRQAEKFAESVLKLERMP